MCFVIYIVDPPESYYLTFLYLRTAESLITFLQHDGCDDEKDNYLYFVSTKQGLCHISELSANWLAKAEDVSISI